ncbi:MAG TPA: hypothetical protein VF733_03705 [Candidatus Saccharimonadales bacterium]
MLKRASNKGFSVIEIVMVLFIAIGLVATGFFIWKKDHLTSDHQKTINQVSRPESKQPPNEPPDETERWTRVVTQNKAFSMKVPDGWVVTSYPGDFLGGVEIVYDAGTSAVIERADAEYAGHMLRFRASISAVGSAGFGPQWESPQPYLEESAQNFAIGELSGKRYKGVFSGDLDQTLYEYVFNIGNGKKLDVVYSIYHNEGEVEDVSTVEKAIQTIQLN